MSVAELEALPGARGTGDAARELAALPGVRTADGMAAEARRARVSGRMLPVREELRELLPAGGLRRGGTVAVRGSSSLLLALLAEATATGSWAAAVGMPDLGLAAARELGVEIARLALVPRPGAEFASVTAALIDGVDLVAVAPGSTSPSVARRLSARARHRGAVLLSLGSWPGAELELEVTGTRWQGLGGGAGHLSARWTDVRVTGRGAAARPRSAGLMLPWPAEMAVHLRKDVRKGNAGAAVDLPFGHTETFFANPTTATAEMGFSEQARCGECPPTSGRISKKGAAAQRDIPVREALSATPEPEAASVQETASESGMASPREAVSAGEAIPAPRTLETPGRSWAEPAWAREGTA